MSVIKFSGVSISRGSHEVLRNVDLQISSNAFIGVLGSNGAGKTTLFQAILGLIKPASGQISVFNRPVKRGNLNIGYLPQARSLPNHIRLEVREFLKSSWDGEKWGFLSASRSVELPIFAALKLVDAQDMMHRPISELSGGERQRILIAQCLMRQPELLILDEPLISLDPSKAQDIIHLIRDIQKSLGITVLLSAHELNPLLGSLDKVLYMGKGIAVLGSVEDVINNSTLSKLYDTKIEVIHVNGRIFVMAGANPVEFNAHNHEHEQNRHWHGHE